MTTRTNLSLLLWFLLLLLAQSFDQTTREGLIKSREKRKKQLERVLEQIDKKLADHRSGKTILAQHKLDHMEHKIQAYQHQIEELDRELDEDEIQRKLEWAKKIQMNKMNQEL